MIFEYLDYGSALALTRTNRFFQNQQPPDYISDSDKLDFVLYAEGFKHNLRRRRLACFVCLTVLRPRHFRRQYRIGGHERVGEEELARRCKRCDEQMRAEGD